jgi:hypothetical protein
MRSCVKDEEGFAEFEEVGIGANVRMGGEVRETHGERPSGGKRWKSKR